MTDNDHQYYWLSATSINDLRGKLEGVKSPLAQSIVTELKVAELRSSTSDIPMSKLRNALGLEAGSRPLWLSSEEHDFVREVLQ